MLRKILKLRDPKKIKKLKDVILSLFLPVSKENWQRYAQEGEFKFHKNDKWRSGGKLEFHSEKLFNSFGFDENSFRGWHS
jgi:hypothetical protein